MSAEEMDPKVARSMDSGEERMRALGYKQELNRGALSVHL